MVVSTNYSIKTIFCPFCDPGAKNSSKLLVEQLIRTVSRDKFSRDKFKMGTGVN